MTLKAAEKYEELLWQLRFRPHALRLLVLRALCTFTEFTDLERLVQNMNAAGAVADKEKVRMIIKRLNEAGFLERQPLAGQNKFLFRLKSYDELHADVQMRISSRHQ
jgi:Fe2+ or Zn2+ uptake regulation protein